MKVTFGIFSKILAFLKRLFGKPNLPPPPEVEPYPEPIPGIRKTALLFAINNYPGTANDLRGCIRDQEEVEKLLNTFYPNEFTIKKFKDAEVTTACFIKEVTKAIIELIPGDFLFIHYSGHGTQLYDDFRKDEDDGYDEALYLYDGTVIDDDIGNVLKSIPLGATVVLMFDSCFSGTITRHIGDERIQSKFHQTLPLRSIKRHRFPKQEMNWLVFSACQENQTSADAFLDGEFHGAFTYYATSTFLKGLTYTDWINRIHYFLPSKAFDQNPTIEGNNQRKIIFT